MGKCYGCDTCRWAEWTEYYPQTEDSPEELPEVDGCSLNHLAWDLNPEEGCSEYDYQPIPVDPRDDY